jgi:hypothetical protein
MQTSAGIRPVGRRSRKRRIALAFLLVGTVCAGSLNASTPAQAFSSFPPYAVHQRILGTLGCAADDALPAADCFQPESLAVLEYAVGAPDLPLVGETASSAHCDNGDYLPPEDDAHPETILPLLRTIWADPRLSGRSPNPRIRLSPKAEKIKETVTVFLADYPRFPQITHTPRLQIPPALRRLLASPRIPRDMKSEDGLRTRLPEYVATHPGLINDETLPIMLGVWTRPPYVQGGQSQAAAKKAIQDCVMRTRQRATSTVAAALASVDTTYTSGDTGIGQACDHGTGLNPLDVDPGIGFVTNPGGVLVPVSRTDKCLALFQLGRGLHTVQDFYAHSNWVDPVAKPGQPLLMIPPGLGRTDPTTLFNLAEAYSPTLPVIENGLITGCYPDETPQKRSDCNANVYHGTTLTFQPEPWSLAKDDVRFDAARSVYYRDPEFHAAETLAVTATRIQWQQMETLIRRQAGTDPAAQSRAQMAICILTHDDVSTCKPTPAPLAVTTSSLPGGTVGHTYPSTTLTASGGTTPYSWTATGLPAGLAVTSNGVLAGTPATAGPATVIVTVTDSNGTSASATLSLTIGQPAVSGVVDLQLNAAIATGGPDGRIWVLARENTLLQTADLIDAVDPATQAIQTYRPLQTNTVGVGEFDSDMAFDGSGDLWLHGFLTADPESEEFVKFNPSTGKTTEYPLPTGCATIFGLYGAADGDIWMHCVSSAPDEPTGLARISSDGASTRIPLTAPSLLGIGSLGSGSGGSVWANALGAGGSIGVVEISANGGQTVYPDKNGVSAERVLGDGGSLVEIGLCPLKLDQYCQESLAEDGTRSDPQPIAYSDPLISDLDGGQIWAIGQDTTGTVTPSGLFTFEATGGAGAPINPFTLPSNPGGLGGILFENQGQIGSQQLAVLASNGTLWLVHNYPFSGSLLGVTVDGG